MFFGAFLLLQVVIPALRSLWQLPRRPLPAVPPATQSGAAPAVTALLVGGLLWLSWERAALRSRRADSKSALPSKDPPLAESVTQDIRIEDKFALATAKIRWQAEKGEVLPLLFEPTVLTRLDYPTNALELVQAPAGSRSRAAIARPEEGRL